MGTALLVVRPGRAGALPDHRDQLWFCLLARLHRRDFALSGSALLVFNAACAPLQFGLRKNGRAALDAVLVLITLIRGSFATALQFVIPWLNR